MFIHSCLIRLYVLVLFISEVFVFHCFTLIEFALTLKIYRPLVLHKHKKEGHGGGYIAMTSIGIESEYSIYQNLTGMLVIAYWTTFMQEGLTLPMPS